MNSVPSDSEITQVMSTASESSPRTQGGERTTRSTVTVPDNKSRYDVRRRIGKGGMATVYEAYDQTVGRLVALKFLNNTQSDDPVNDRRFLDEARAAGALAHTNIVVVFDAGEIDGQRYISMELLQGAPLNEAGKPGGMPVREVVEIGIQLGRALGHAHNHGVFHRDIKPSNIIRLNDGKTIKVTDFGIAHMEDAERTLQTQEGTVLGTLQYMSPEQAMGLRIENGLSDLYSAGAVMYQLLAGKPPFESTNPLNLLRRIPNEDPTPIGRLRPDVPASLQRVIERCMQKKPEKRFRTGEELADALELVLAELDEGNIVPLRLKWTIIMAAVVAVAMTLTAGIVTQRQYAAIMGQVIEYGAYLAKFLAKESAKSAVLEEWVDVEVSVQETMRSQQLHFYKIAVLDRQNIVRVSSDSREIDKPYVASPGAGKIDSDIERVVVQKYVAPSGETILDFDVPITYGQGKAQGEYGRLHLGIREQPLSRVAYVSLGWLAFMIVVTVITVTLATYLIARRYSKPLSQLSRSMDEIGKGRLDYRIAQQRNDEFGQVYNAFDRMAQALQARSESEEVKPPPPPSN